MICLGCLLHHVLAYNLLLLNQPGKEELDIEVILISKAQFQFISLQMNNLEVLLGLWNKAYTESRIELANCILLT